MHRVHATLLPFSERVPSRCTVANVGHSQVERAREPREKKTDGFRERFSRSVWQKHDSLFASRDRRKDLHGLIPIKGLQIAGNVPEEISLPFLTFFFSLASGSFDGRTQQPAPRSTSARLSLSSPSVSDCISLARLFQYSERLDRRLGQTDDESDRARTATTKHARLNLNPYPPPLGTPARSVSLSITSHTPSVHSRTFPQSTRRGGWPRAEADKGAPDRSLSTRLFFPFFFEPSSRRGTGDPRALSKPGMSETRDADARRPSG